MIENKALYRVFVIGFLVLYACVALISFCHAIEFFNIGNVEWMSIVLAGAFELGLALSLASVLLSGENKKAVLPWILTIVLTFVQVIGNVYSVYKFIAESGTDYYKYLANPTLFWIEDISQDTVMIIISWIMGAILPVIALLMTDMVASNIKHMKKLEREAKSAVVSVPVNCKEDGIQDIPESETAVSEMTVSEPGKEDPFISEREEDTDEPSDDAIYQEEHAVEEDPATNPVSIDDVSTQIKKAYNNARVTNITDDIINDYPG